MPQAGAPRTPLLRPLQGASAGIFTGILLMPVLPFLEDSEENVTEVVRLAHESGARFVYPFFGVTLRQNQREHFLDELERRFPGEGLRARYERQYGTYYQCVSPNAKKLWAAFTSRCGALGLLYEMKHITSAYQHGYADMQLSFF